MLKITYIFDDAQCERLPEFDKNNWSKGLGECFHQADWLSTATVVEKDGVEFVISDRNGDFLPNRLVYTPAYQELNSDDVIV